MELAILSTREERIGGARGPRVVESWVAQFPPKGVGVALAVGGTEGHKVAPPADSGFSWSQETVKLQKTQKCERKVSGDERSYSGSERHAKVHGRAENSWDCEDPRLVDSPQSTEVWEVVIELQPAVPGRAAEIAECPK